jgi:predicted ATP-grasp superfamily ATP-dependent carboligase
VATRLLIAGVSTRAAAESAAKAGFAVTAIDAFGDLDQHPAVRSLSLPHQAGAPFTAQAAAEAGRAIDADAAAYLSPFENHRRAVEALSYGRALWGNPPDVLRRVRDPFLLSGLLRRRGFATPITRVDVPREFADSKEWLLKPFNSGGGYGVRPWTPDTNVSPGVYAQERISGVPASIVFVAAGGRAVALGISRQLIGEAAFGASGYRYCGNVLASAHDEVLTEPVVQSMVALAACVTEQFGLVGLNGIDCIVREHVPYPIEVNPRWCSSMELVERQYGVSVFGVHAAACADGVLPAFDLRSARRDRPVVAKAIIFALADGALGDTWAWLGDETVSDVPKPGERLTAGQPVCTIFATGADDAGCRAALDERAAALYRALAISMDRSKQTLEQKRATT